MASGGELQQVQAVDGGDLDTRQVAEGLGDAGVASEDNEGPLAENVATVTHLT